MSGLTKFNVLLFGAMSISTTIAAGVGVSWLNGIAVAAAWLMLLLAGLLVYAIQATVNGKL